MPRYFEPAQPKRGWQRSKRNTDKAAKKSQVRFSMTSNGDIVPKVTAVDKTDTGPVSAAPPPQVLLVDTRDSSKGDGASQHNDGQVQASTSSDGKNNRQPQHLTVESPPSPTTTELRKSKEEIDTLKKQNKKNQMEIEEMKQTLTESTKTSGEKIKELEGYLNHRETELSRCQAELKRRNKELSRMERAAQEYSASRQLVERLQARVSELELQLTQQGQGPSTPVRNSMRRLEQQNADMKKELDSKISDIASLVSMYEAKLKNAKEIIDGQQEKMANLEADFAHQLQSERAANEQLRSELSGLLPSRENGGSTKKQQQQSQLHSHPMEDKEPESATRSSRKQLATSPTRTEKVTRIQTSKGVVTEPSKRSRLPAHSPTSSLVSSVPSPKRVPAKPKVSVLELEPTSSKRKTEREEELSFVSGLKKKSRAAVEPQKRGKKSTSGRLTAEIRSLHHSNTVHGVQTEILSEMHRQRKTTPENKRSLLRRNSFSDEPTDSLAGIDSVSRPTNSSLRSRTSKKTSMYLEMSSPHDTTDSSDDSSFH